MLWCQSNSMALPKSLVLHFKGLNKEIVILFYKARGLRDIFLTKYHTFTLRHVNCIIGFTNLTVVTVSLLQPDLKKGAWTEKEDNILKEEVSHTNQARCFVNNRFDTHNT